MQTAARTAMLPAPCSFTLHKADVLEADSWLLLQTRQLQAAAAFAVNGVQQEPLAALPDPANATAGSLLHYSRTPAPNTLYAWNGTRYNDTTATLLVQGAQHCVCRSGHDALLALHFSPAAACIAGNCEQVLQHFIPADTSRCLCCCNCPPPRTHTHTHTNTTVQAAAMRR